MRILKHPLLLLLVPVAAFAAQYPYFAPGGALSCTGNCTTQSVNVGSGAFITGLLPNANLANSSITLNGNVIALGTSDVLALASADFANQGTTTTVLHGNAAGNPSFALVNLGTEVTSLLPFANIDPAMVPTWTGATWTWSNTQPRLLLNETDQGTDLKLWDFDLQAGVLTGRTRTDADGAGVNWLSVTRGTTTAITNISLGNATNNPTFTILGSGVMTINSSTLTGLNSTAVFGRIRSQSSGPVIDWNENDQGTDLKQWGCQAQSAVFTCMTETDAPANGKAFMTITRGATTAISAVSMGNATDNPTFSVLGTGNETFNGTQILMPNLGTSSAATTGTLCWTTGTGLVNVDTTTTCLLSSQRYKQNIHNLNVGLAEVMQLRPVSYRLRPEYDPTLLGVQVGLIAEDVAKVDARLVSVEHNGSPHAVRYQQLTAVLIKAVQEQQQQIEQLKSEIHLLHRTH